MLQNIFNLISGWGPETVARISKAAFHYLDAPSTRLAAHDTPAPTAPGLEREYMPGVQRVVGVFPNEASCLRLIAALLMEIREE